MTNHLTSSADSTGPVRDAGGKVAWVVPSVGPPSPWQVGFYGTAVATSHAASGGSGTPADRVAPELDVEAGDFVGDATADVSDRAHDAALRTVYRSFGDVRGVDDLFGLTRA